MDPGYQSALIRGLRTGDRGAWTALYDEYSGQVWLYVARLLGGQGAEVADILQDTFLVAARGARQFDPARGTLRAWLCGIAHHHVHRYWRQAARRDRVRKLAEAGGAELCRWLNGTAEPAEEWNRRELADLVRGVLAEMNAEPADLLAAKYLDERSLAEMASERGGTVEAIKSKLARARREFRTKFEFVTKRSEGCRVPSEE